LPIDHPYELTRVLFSLYAFGSKGNSLTLFVNRFSSAGSVFTFLFKKLGSEGSNFPYLHNLLDCEAGEFRFEVGRELKNAPTSGVFSDCFANLNPRCGLFFLVFVKP
jgi:hypothetical protein